MPGNHQYVPGVQYIAGRTFQSEYGVHEAGTVVKEAEKFQNLDVLVSARFLWPYAPDEGYDWLPPHLFNDVHTMAEVQAALDIDPTRQAVPQFPATDSAEEDEKPQVIRQAEFEAEQQVEIREKIRATAQPGLEVEEGPTPEDVAEEATGGQRVPVKRTAKKANPRSRNA